MDRDEIIARLKAEEPALRARGVQGLSLFGSLARGEAGPQSDVDVLIDLRLASQPSGWAYFATLDAIEEDFRAMFGVRVDVVPDPPPPGRFGRRVERERLRVF